MGGDYSQGNLVPEKTLNDNELLPNKRTCQQLVGTLLNEDPAFAAELRAATGCTSYVENGKTVTGCSFSTSLSAYFERNTPYLWEGKVSLYVQDVYASWTCNVLESDNAYKKACCNTASPQFIVGTDPRTGQVFDPNSCDPNWCLSDPSGYCSTTFDECAGVSPCNRHWFLSNIPLPSTDLMINSLTLLPTNSFVAKKGLRCNDWYTETVKQAIQRTTLLQGATERVISMMNTISGFCGSPEFRGQGECSCYNGYISHGVPWERADSGDTLEFQYKTRNNEDIYQPFIVAQDGVGQIRRYDAFCSQQGNPSFSAPLSFSDNGTFITYSNVCSTTTPYSDKEYPYPTINPAKSIRSLTNFGDVVNYEPTDPSGNSLLGQIETFPMPMHCWLPACVAEGVPDTAVFRNLWALGVRPCPPICYQVSAGDSIAIGGSGAADAHIHSNFVSCDFGYTNSVFPFAYPAACRAISVDVPAYFQGVFTIPFTYPSLDISSVLVTTSLSAYTNAFPVIGIVDGGVAHYSISDKLIDKYNPYDPHVFNLSVSIDVTQEEPFSSFLADIIVSNNTYEFDSIIVKVSVWGSGTSARGPAFSTGCCDPQFGNLCSPTPEEQLGTQFMVLGDGRALSFFGQSITPPASNLVLTRETLDASGARNRNL